MTDPKVKEGDRVHVEFDGIVTHERTGGTFDVDVADIDYTVGWVPPAVITVLPPEIKRDDVIADADVLDTLPEWSAISTDGHVWVLDQSRTWWHTTLTGVGPWKSADVLQHGSAIVLRVGR